MSRNGSGGYTAPSNSFNPAINGAAATASDWNATLSDLSAAIAQSISADGQTTITGNLQMGGNKLTNLAAGSAAGQSVRFEQLFGQGALTDIASASITDIGQPLTNFLRVTGTTGITSFGTNYNGPKYLIFAGAVTLTHSATLVLPGAANITTAENDALIAIPISGGWQVVSYLRASGDVLAKSLNGGQLAGFRNKLINGDFQVWQRGTSFPAVAGITYTADRWALFRTTLSLGATALQIPLPSGQFCIRVQRNAGNASTDPIQLVQCIRSSTARRLAGQTITVSLKQRTGVNISTSNIGVSLIWGTGVDQGVNSARSGGWSGQTSILSGGIPTGQPTFTPAAFQFAVPAAATELMLAFVYTPTGTAGAEDFFDLSDVQLEVGTVATPFESRMDMELALCLPYAQIVMGGYGGPSVNSANNTAYLPLQSPMRATPTVTWLYAEFTNNFPSSIASIANVSSRGFRVSKTAFITAQDSSFFDAYLVAAEL